MSNANLAIKLRDLDLSVRAMNTLVAAGLSTLGDVALLTRDQLLKNRNMGAKSLREIEGVMEYHGLSFSPDPSAPLKPLIPPSAPQYVFLPVPLTDLVNEIVRAIRADLDTATPPPPEELLTRVETAKQLHVTLPTLRQYTRRGYVKGYRMGNRVLYKRSEVLNALQQMRTAKQTRQ